MSIRTIKVHAFNTAHMRTTKNTLPSPARHAAIETLDMIAACMMDLSLAARQAHWNVRGSQFSPLHDLFRRLSEELNKNADVLAERTAALGGIPRCTTKDLFTTTKLKPYPSLGVDGADHVEELAKRMTSLSSELRLAILAIDGQGDPVTTHHLTDVAAAVDHLLWLLESQLPVDEVGNAANAQ